MRSNDWLRYANAGATRNMPLSPQLASALAFLPEMGLGMEVFSGGQPGKGTSSRRIGSTRHDHGNAADVFFTKDGKRLDWANASDRPMFEEIVRRAKANGVTGFGAGPGYMQPGSMHIGFGSPSVWGAGGSARNAPDWLVSAYNSTGPAAPTRGRGMAALLDGPPKPPPVADGPKGREMLPPDYSNMPDGPKGQEAYPTQLPKMDVPAGPPGGLLGGDIPPEVAQYATADGEGGSLAKGLGGFFKALAQFPDAPTPRHGPQPDATGSADGIMKILQNPTMGQLLLSRRFQAGRR